MCGSQNNINILKPPDIHIRVLSSSRVARNPTKLLGAVILIEALSIGHFHAYLQRHGLMMGRLHQWYYASRWFGLAVSFDRDAWAQGG